MSRSVNIINFIRAVEPRADVDLLEPVVRQMELARRHRLPVTWLLQYDALIEPKFTDFLKANMDYSHEVGGWFEVVQPQAERAGVPWRGRFPWDWHVNTGFSVGYTPAERERLADVFMEDFLRVWGFYPDSVGSWFVDAHLLNYLHERYGVTASCNCKDQWGTDGYTLWGGYWANAYYPSRLNSYLPAQTAANQIPVPVFRMLGSDPIYQYDAKIGSGGQSVITLEPVYAGTPDQAYGGGDPAWTRWFFDTTFTTPCLAMSYAQAGQENSFGWRQMAAGIADQFALIAEWAAAGKLQAETLKTSARRFRNAFALTPATAVTALDDWRHQGRASVWYLSRFHRLNFHVANQELGVRDWQLFDEAYQEPFLRSPCPSASCVYDALPVMDGLLWGDGEHKASMSFRQLRGGRPAPLPGHVVKVEEVGTSSLSLLWRGDAGIVSLVASETELAVDFDGFPGAIEYRFVSGHMAGTTVEAAGERSLNFRHNQFAYSLHCRQGRFVATGDGVLVMPEEGRIILACR